MFQETVREMGLNKYLFEMTNIRDQCSWVHMHQPEEATKRQKNSSEWRIKIAPLASP
jgi:heterodisulfide reductase subunit A-like polyferredoxin